VFSPLPFSSLERTEGGSADSLVGYFSVSFKILLPSPKFWNQMLREAKKKTEELWKIQSK
jgi:hypothetical protein